MGTVALLGVLSSGCGVTLSAGNPVPVGNEMRTGDSPARPREVRLDGKDPCGLIPRSDWRKFHIEEPGEPQRNEPLKSPQCFYNARVGAFGITLVTTEDIDAWRGGKRYAKDAEVAPVKGFPAISLKNPVYETGCDIAVDVADGQYLLAELIIDIDEVSRLPERCEYAHQWAESAMSTLVGS